MNFAKQKSELNVLLCYRNMKAGLGVSHIGLGVSSLNNAKLLNSIGIKAQAIALAKKEDIVDALNNNTGVTHIVIAAPWIPTDYLRFLTDTYHNVQFAVVCHSNVGFLQADRGAIKLIKEAIQLENSTYNFHVVGNVQKFTDWVEHTFGEPATCLPNMYYLHHRHGETKRLWKDTGGTLRIGMFGATRILKNMLSGAAAAMEISADLNAQTELWINSGRDEGDPRVRGAIKELLAGMPNITLQELDWASWNDFKRQVGRMHLLLQPSYTETFNMVTADGVSEGIPSVVSDAIVWAPKSWKAEVDDVTDIARVGIHLINDSEAGRKGLEALQQHNHYAERLWVDYLCLNRFGHNTLSQSNHHNLR